MTNLLVLFIFMLTIFVSYVGYVWNKFGVLPSISESYYRLPDNLKKMFTFFCWGFSFPAIILGTLLTDNLLMFVAGSGIAFVGAAAAFKERMSDKVHTIGAVIGVVLSQLSILLDFRMYIVNLIFVALSLILIIGRVKNKVWWIELIAFTAICVVLGSTLY